MRIVARSTVPTVLGLVCRQQWRHNLKGSTVTTAYVTPEQLAAMATIAKCASVNDNTPIVEQLQIRVESTRIITIATDRYRVGRLTLPLDEDYTPTDGTIVVHPSLLVQAVKAAGKDAMRATVVKLHQSSDTEPVTIELTHTGTVFSAPAATGNFPPVERLIDESTRLDDIPTGVGLTAKFLATLKELRLPGESPADAGRVAWKLTTKVTESGKHGPIMFARANGSGVSTLEYFLQPNNLR